MRQLDLMLPPSSSTLPSPVQPLPDQAREQLVEKLARLIGKAVIDDNERDIDQEGAAHE